MKIISMWAQDLNNRGDDKFYWNNKGFGRGNLFSADESPELATRIINSTSEVSSRGKRLGPHAYHRGGTVLFEFDSLKKDTVGRSSGFSVMVEFETRDLITPDDPLHHRHLWRTLEAELTRFAKFAQDRGVAPSAETVFMNVVKQLRNKVTVQVGGSVALVAALLLFLATASVYALKKLLSWAKTKSKPAAVEIGKAWKALKRGKKKQAKKHVGKAILLLGPRDSAKLKMLVERVSSRRSPSRRN